MGSEKTFHRPQRNLGVDSHSCGIGECGLGWAILRKDHPWNSGLHSHKQETSHCRVPHKGGPQTMDTRCCPDNYDNDDIDIHNVNDRPRACS